MSVEATSLMAVTGIPQPNGVVPGPGGDQEPIGGETDALHVTRVTSAAEHLAAGGGVPKANCLVLGSRRYAPTIRRDGNAPDLAEVTYDAQQSGASVSIPQPHGAVI
jgi:hypothetical protein